MDENVPSFGELKERIDLIIDQYYSILSKNVAKEKAGPLLEQFQRASNIAREIKIEEDRENSEQQHMEETINDTDTMCMELTKCLQLQKQKQINIRTERANLTAFYRLFHLYTCNLKQTTLLLKSHKLSQNEQIKLTCLKEEFAKLHTSNVMFRLIQLNKENDDGEYILNQIDKETEEELRAIKEKEVNMEKEVLILGVHFDMAVRDYEQKLSEGNNVKIRELQGNQKKMPVKFRTTASLTTQDQLPSRETENGPIPTEVIYISSPYEKHEKVFGLILLLVSIVLLFSVCISYLRSSTSLV